MFKGTRLKSVIENVNLAKMPLSSEEKLIAWAKKYDIGNNETVVFVNRKGDRFRMISLMKSIIFTTVFAVPKHEVRQRAKIIASVLANNTPCSHIIKAKLWKI